MESEEVDELCENKKKVLEKIAAILRWQKNATVFINERGITLTFADGGQLFFENEKKDDADSASLKASSWRGFFMSWNSYLESVQ